MVTLFGFVAVTIMMISYWLEPRSKWFLLLFAGGCASTSAYSGLVEAYPITVIETLWSAVALHRFRQRLQQEIPVAV
jgi:hypothetical protein